MSLYDFGQLSPEELVLNYLIEVRGKGFFFSQNDLKFIKQWLILCPSVEELLVILADEAECYFGHQQSKNSTSRKSLFGLNRIILRKIKDRAMLGFRGDTNEASF